MHKNVDMDGIQDWGKKQRFKPFFSVLRPKIIESSTRSCVKQKIELLLRFFLMYGIISECIWSYFDTEWEVNIETDGNAVSFFNRRMAITVKAYVKTVASTVVNFKPLPKELYALLVLAISSKRR